MSESNLDILSIDAKIRSKFKNEIANLNKYKNRLQELHTTLKNGINTYEIKKSIKDLEEKIKKIENRSEKHFYIAETGPLLQQYRKILTTPVQVSFTGRARVKNKEKIKVVRCYINIAQKYKPDIHVEQKEKKLKLVCDNCKNKKNFYMENDSSYVCQECGAQKDILLHSTSYKDADRINISTKYSYDRKVHFRDCINQYQGKQNCTVEQKVYDNLEDQFRRHHLLVDSPQKEKKFSKITKEHVTMFLKELGLTKHYENVNLIHYNMTGKKPDDISHLEDRLLTDFDALTEVYDKIFKHKISRTNFINTQYVLYQLLKRHKHPCKKTDFVMLKTVDRQAFHDSVAEVLFRELGWNLTPLY